MTSEQISAYNKIIGEFDVPEFALLKEPNYKGEIPSGYLFTAAALCAEDYLILNYCTSWNSLIPICHKIDNIYQQHTWMPLSKEWKEYERLCDKLDAKIILYEIEPVVAAVIEFIEWYNNLPKASKLTLN
jgi:hypothetical protein